MVRRGEYLERAVVVPHGESSLDGLYHRGTTAPAVLVLAPHAERGSMEIPTIAEVAWAAARAGHATLRFNYPGVGASPGTFTFDAAVSAVASAAEHLSLSAPAPSGGLAVLAFGWGASVVAGAATAGRFDLRSRGPHADTLGDGPRVDPLILVQPPDSVWAPFTGWTGSICAVFAEGDDISTLETARASAAACPAARVVAVKGADAEFRAGLVGLGRTVVETLTSGPASFDGPPEDDALPST